MKKGEEKINIFGSARFGMGKRHAQAHASHSHTIRVPRNISTPNVYARNIARYITVHDP